MMKEYHNSARNQSVSSEIQKFGRIPRRQEAGDERKNAKEKRAHVTISKEEIPEAPISNQQMQRTGMSREVIMK